MNDMIKASITELKANFSRLLARVEAGEEVIITQRGKPIAKLVAFQR
jgi:prevent-host-death family protein